ncbi:MAG: polymorphic toxin-type HINT domain-containing protein [Patescibacteria group bacterium]
MEDKKFTNRSVDKLKMQKSKNYLWKQIETRAKKGSQTDPEPEDNPFGVLDFFKSLFKSPKRFIPVGVVAAVLIVALVFTTNFGNLFLGRGINADVVEASFAMVAADQDTSGVDQESGFSLTSSIDYDEDVIKDHLLVTPQAEVKVERVGEGEYQVTPIDDLEANKVYNFSILSEQKDAKGDIKKVEYSWSYQVKDTFKIINTLPGDKTTYIPLNSGVEVNFSHGNFDLEAAKNSFEITPATPGRFEKHQKTLVFIADKGLQPSTLYTVKVKKGLALGGSDQTLTEDLIFSFETSYLDGEKASKFNFGRTYYEAKTDATISMMVDAWQLTQEGVNSISVDVYKYPSYENFMAALNDSHKAPYWATLSRQNYQFDTSKLQKVGTFEAPFTEVNWITYAYLPEAQLGEGNYLLQVQDGRNTKQAFLQVTDLSAFVTISQTESLVWVNDLKTGEAVKDAKINFSKSDVNTQTDSRGIATFDTPEEWKEIKGYEGNLEFAEVTAGDKKLIMELGSYYFDSGSRDKYWYGLYTDRPVYQPNDTVEFWGFIKDKTAKDDLDDLRLEIKYSGDALLQTIPLEVDGDGVFKGKITVKNYLPGYYYANVMKGEEYFSAFYFEVKDYTKPAYNLTIEPNKKAVFANEPVNFDIEAAFFDGTPVANMELSSSIPGAASLRTDQNGKATASLKAPKGACNDMDKVYCSDSHSEYYEIHPTMSESSAISGYANVMVFDSKLHVKAENITEKNQEGKNVGTVKIQTNWVDLEKLNKVDDDEMYLEESYLGKIAPNRKVNLQLRESYWTKIDNGEYYDFIQKKIVKKYGYYLQNRDIALKNPVIQTNDNGEATYEVNMNKESYYTLFVSAADDAGSPAMTSVYVFGDSGRMYDYDYNQIQITTGKTQDGGMWGDARNEFDIGEEVKAEFTNNNIKIPVEKGAKFLFLEESSGIQDFTLTDKPEYSFEFGKSYVPNVIVDGVMFTGNGYKNFWEDIAYYKKDLKELNVEIEADEKKYEPGDEVKLSVKVTDKDGDPLQAKVNLNLVDEAYYVATYENFTDILGDLYMPVSSGVLITYDTHQDPAANAQEGGKGGCFTGETRILMADGSYKVIKDIREGDEILTKRDAKSGQMVPARVNGTVSHFVSEYLVVNENLEVTKEHIVFVNGKWMPIGDAKIGDKMLGKDGELITINNIRKVNAPVWVYNFEVDELHTYFANDYYVHNSKDGDMIRDDFEDTALFEVIETNNSGYAEVKFKLPDNVTSWRVMAQALDLENLQAGQNTANIAVGLPFFVDVVGNDEFSVKDEPYIKVRAYGDELTDKSVIHYAIEDWSGVKSPEMMEKAFESIPYKLPKLVEGTHSIILSGKSGEFEDAVEKEITVVGSRLRQEKVEVIDKVSDKTSFSLAKNGPTQIEFMDAGAAKFYGDLWMLACDCGDRLDQKVAQVMANDLINKYFKEGAKYNNEYLAANYQKSGLSILPYADPDLKLTSLVVLMGGGEYFEETVLANYLNGFYQNKDENLDQIIYAISGLAALHEPVLLSLDQIKTEKTLSLEHEMLIAMAYNAIGEKDSAKEIYEKNLDRFLKPKEVKATAFAAILASDFGDLDQAAKFWEFVENGGLEDEVLNLYKLGYLKASLKHLDTKAVSFNIKFNDDDHEVTLEPWQTYSVMAFAGDKVETTIKQGQLSAVKKTFETIEPENFVRDDSLGITRKYFVNGVETTQFTEGQLVEVRLELKTPEPIKSWDLYGVLMNRSGFYRVTDIVPSGLKPVTGYGNYDTNSDYPYSVSGQEISFYWDYWMKSSVYRKYPDGIAYYARVVSPGKYYADPAKIESYYDQVKANISESAMIEIKAFNVVPSKEPPVIDLTELQPIELKPVDEPSA